MPCALGGIKLNTIQDTHTHTLYMYDDDDRVSSSLMLLVINCYVFVQKITF